MTIKHAIAFSLSLALTGVFAIPPGASAQFDLDLQATEIGNQLQEILNRVTQYTSQLTQFTRLDCSASRAWRRAHEATPVNEAAVVCDTLDMVGAFRDSYPRLLAVPTGLLNTPAPFPDWRDLLGAADTVTEADIRNVYPDSADRCGGRLSAAARLCRSQHRPGTCAGRCMGPHLRIPWTRPRPLLRTLKRAAASPARLLHKLKWLPRSPGRAYSSHSPTFALKRRPPRPWMPTTRKWRGGRSPRAGSPTVPLLKRSGPRNRATVAAAADQRIQSMYGGFQIPAGLGGN